MGSYRPLCPEDMHRIILIGDPQFSPDGNEICFVRLEFSREENQFYRNIWLIDKQHYLSQLTEGKNSYHSPRWAPTGSKIAFVSGSQNRIVIIDRNGNEQEVIECGQTVTSAPVWSPDGSHIAFLANVTSSSGNRLPYEAAPADDDSRNNGVKVIHSVRYGQDVTGLRRNTHTHVFAADVFGNAEQDNVCRQVTEGDIDHLCPAWSATGEELYFAANRDEDDHLMFTQDIWKMNLSSNRLSKVLSGDGHIMEIACSPDGKKLAFGSNIKHGGSGAFVDAYVVDLTESETIEQKKAKNLTSPLEGEIGWYPLSIGGSCPRLDLSIKWNEDCSAITVGYGKGGSSAVVQIDVLTGNISTLWYDPERVMSEFDIAKDNSLVIALGNSTSPANMFLVQDGIEEQLTNNNTWIAEEVKLSKSNHFSYKGDNDWDIDGWYLLPTEGEGPFPTVLFVHGGPFAAYGNSFMFHAQLLATNGIAVVYTNPRGSTGYGLDFATANIGDTGGSDYIDIMNGLDYVINKGIADPERLGIYGWSYGGFMTCWAITQTNRFKAALAGGCISNRISFYGTSDRGILFTEGQNKGTPWKDWHKLYNFSPIRYADKVMTPLMLMHGEMDPRTPVGQSEEMFTALRRQGKECVLIRYPGEGHGVVQPRHSEDLHKRLLSWFRYYLT